MMKKKEQSQNSGIHRKVHGMLSILAGKKNILNVNDLNWDL